jgi:hypothetical protein
MVYSGDVTVAYKPYYNGKGMKLYSWQTAIGERITDISYSAHSKSCFSFSKPKEVTMRKRIKKEVFSIYKMEHTYLVVEEPRAKPRFVPSVVETKIFWEGLNFKLLNSSALNVGKGSEFSI